ncbi:hypothetical protein XENOCAPTIV_029388 [Xenoophorus captivus]|uniref:Uncharacterized protein n=1 Tax=Xenoophorus captivus TaxID=1517983 RepID=A0ABV0R5G2_9TELE
MAYKRVSHCQRIAQSGRLGKNKDLKSLTADGNGFSCISKRLRWKHITIKQPRPGAPCKTYDRGARRIIQRVALQPRSTALHHHKNIVPKVGFEGGTIMVWAVKQHMLLTVHIYKEGMNREMHLDIPDRNLKTSVPLPWKLLTGFRERQKTARM